MMISLIVLVQYSVYNKWAFMLACWGTFMCDGAMLSIMPVITIDQFGMTRGPQVYSFMYSNMAVASMLSVLVLRTLESFDYGYP
mmetsp:Transcript_7853/g.13169  ORF Transcript_7853/g.13169 Transcript_7853/m.13169 type:complete len:84 (+) Transcript_7853:1163-1414(+)